MDPVPTPARDYADGEPLSPRAIARIAFGEAAMDASEYARMVVPTIGEEHLRPGELIRSARRLRLLALEVLERAIAVERATGATWEQVAEALNLDVEVVIRRYSDLPLDPKHPDPDAPAARPSEHHERIETLDRWCQRRGIKDRLLRDIRHPFKVGLRAVPTPDDLD